MSKRLAAYIPNRNHGATKLVRHEEGGMDGEKIHDRVNLARRKFSRKLAKNHRFLPGNPGA